MVQELVAEETSRYHTEVGLLDETSHYGRLALLVGHNKQVLELGCSTGYFSNALTKQFGCTVTGVEIDKGAAQEASKVCQRVICGDLDKPELLSVLHDSSFDVVVLSDVLEHLRDPHGLLMEIKRLLKPSGYIVASIPHVGHGSIRLSLLSGQFPYRRMGLLDDTHLKFFDRIELENLFHQSGYELSEVNRNRWSIFDSEVGSRVGYVPKAVSDLLKSDAESDTYQFIVKASVRKQPANLKGSLDFVIFETANQPLNDRVKNYLSQLNLAGLNTKYHAVRANGQVETFIELPLEQFEFGNHDFRTFRYTFAGDGDFSPESAGTRPSFHLNKGQILNQLKSNLTGDYVFITDTQHLPTIDCIEELVIFANANVPGVIAATPEVYLTGSPYKKSAGVISWSPFECTLMSRSILETAVDATLSSPAQEADFCWQLAQKGLDTVQVPSAKSFSFGLRTNDNQARELLDAIRLRLQWKSNRAAIGFIKNNIVANQSLSLSQKASLLMQIALSAPVWLAGQRTIKVPGKIGFYGPGSVYCGNSPQAQ